MNHNLGSPHMDKDKVKKLADGVAHVVKRADAVIGKRAEAASNKEHVTKKLAEVGVAAKPGKTFMAPGGGGHHYEQSHMHGSDAVSHYKKQGWEHTGSHSTNGIKVGTGARAGAGRHVSGDTTHNFKHPNGVTMKHTSGFGRPSTVHSVPPK